MMTNKEKAIEFCETWFNKGARGSWCPEMVDELAEIIQQTRRAALVEAVGRACMYCGKHCPPWHPEVQGPNEAGNYSHKRKEVSRHGCLNQTMCQASSIWALIRWIDNGDQPIFSEEIEG